MQMLNRCTFKSRFLADFIQQKREPSQETRPSVLVQPMTLLADCESATVPALLFLSIYCSLMMRSSIRAIEGICDEAFRTVVSRSCVFPLRDSLDKRPPR